MAKLVHDIQKKQHRERSQVNDRKRLGFLEKHKDYQKRSRDYHKKQTTLKYLKSKVKQRNPDEYYHGMNKARLGRDGLLIKSRHGDDANESSLSNDQVKLLKSQDVNYIRTLRLNEDSKINKLRSQLKFESQGNHKVFVEDKKDLETFDPLKFFNTTSDLLNRKENRLSMEQLSSLESQDNIRNPLLNLKKKQRKSLKLASNVKRHIERSQDLLSLENKMNYNNELLKNGSKKKIVKNGVRTFKWKKQRKR
ncbi:U3 small nucleolar RNA-associated protein 11 [Monosporozyma unispora]|nr:hypothetical protein C6P44_004965 [Kazachstania unispora]